jgi:carboxypeptidase PM20D1
VSIDAQAVAGRLAEAVRFRTVSHQDPALIDAAAFNALRQFLQQACPRVHGALKQEVVSEHNLLYTWEGRDKGLKPNAGPTDSIYRFSPIRVRPGDLDRIHGTDERISVAD